jgi:hypothetical protein
VAVANIVVHSLAISRSTISVIDLRAKHLKLINCNEVNPAQTEVIFNPSPLPEKQMDIIALGKGGFAVAIGTLNQDPLAVT